LGELPGEHSKDIPSPKTPLNLGSFTSNSCTRNGRPSHGITIKKEFQGIPYKY
jgi:hypothetical protein